MKQITGLLALLAVAFVLPIGNASAAPVGAVGQNPNIVAYYPTGPHGIPGESEYHEGMDIVMATDSNGNFQQWFYGWSASEGLHGEHSVWKIRKDGKDCDKGWLLYPDPYPEWGDYLTPGVDYCVKTNDFRP